ncbi:MAG: hypothetical protein AUI57_04525 [Candidatus Rokubacteria bacterium 13_1_40CM_2_68_8]|nr:MAG: hypothetical protein AUI57_04525 [Candidatus Rokubacteria bacterium 13_1_40CM_2_68_8]
MTLRPLPRSRLDRLVPPLVASQALVTLVPATANLRWAAAAAWDAARAASQGGRRVALVDLWLDAPLLHETVGLDRDEGGGIVDAFEFGVSLTKTAHEVGGVYFIPAGSETVHTQELLSQPRWRRLQAGFRSEGALLLLFLSAPSLAKLGAVPDGVLVLSPDGFELEAAGAEGVRDALGRGATLLGTVRESWTTPPQPRPRASGVSRRRRAGLLVLGILLAGGGGWALLARSAEAPRRSERHGGGGAGRAAPTPPLPAATSPAPRADSAAWTVQLAAYGTLRYALAHADRLAAERAGEGEEGGGGAFVTPIALNAAGTVWYRVLVGAYATRDAAAAGRASMWHRGLVPRGQGDLLRAPYSFALDSAADIAALRGRGVAAIRWSMGGRILVGAFETAEQAALAGTQLKRAGVHATLVTRTGTTR